jgi:hypothetical protein
MKSGGYKVGWYKFKPVLKVPGSSACNYYVINCS